MPGLAKRLFQPNFSAARCPQCDGLIGSEAINIKEGMALCPGCAKLSRLSELNNTGRSLAHTLASPPAGCLISSDGHRATVTVSLRSFGGFVFPACFALFWNGILSVFVLVAFAGLYTNLIGPLPNWFPAPEINDGDAGKNGNAMDLGETLFLCAFLIPFVVIGVGMAGAAIMNLVGKVHVVIDECDSFVTTGFGFVRWKKRFDPLDVQAVELCSLPWQSDSAHSRCIELKGSQSVKFGSWLPAERMEWLRAVLMQILMLTELESAERPFASLMWLSRDKQ